MFDITSLKPRIRQILSAPGTDLTTISAKRVRRRLLEIEPALSAEFLKVNKDAVDAVIGSVFEKVQAGHQEGSDSGGGGDDDENENDENDAQGRGGMDSVKRKKSKGRAAATARGGANDTGEEGDDDGGDGDGDGTSSPLPRKTKKATKKSPRELTDAELARQLSSEINSRSRRTTRGGVNGLPRKAGRKAKSSELVDTDGEDSADPDGRSRKRKIGGGSAKGGFAKEYTLR